MYLSKADYTTSWDVRNNSHTCVWKQSKASTTPLITRCLNPKDWPKSTRNCSKWRWMLVCRLVRTYCSAYQRTKVATMKVKIKLAKTKRKNLWICTIYTSKKWRSQSTIYFNQLQATTMTNRAWTSTEATYLVVSRSRWRHLRISSGR